MRGRPLDRYVLVDELGRGPTGSVHLAYADAGPAPFLPAKEDPELGGRRWVAIKRIDPQRVRVDAALVEALAAAVHDAQDTTPPFPRLAARGSLVAPFEVFVQDGAVHLVTDYVHGVTLTELVGLSPSLPIAVAQGFIGEIVLALSTLSLPWLKSKDPVHGHLSRGNVFVTFEGRVVFTDLGTARLLAGRTRHATPEAAAYLSPEQASGAAPDERSDTFALGVHLWELTTGRRLFRRETGEETLAAVRACDVPKPRSMVPEYPVELEERVLGALSKDPASRLERTELLSVGRFFERELAKTRIVVEAGEVPPSAEDYLRPLLSDRKRAHDAYLRSHGYRGGGLVS